MAWGWLVLDVVEVEAVDLGELLFDRILAQATIVLVFGAWGVAFPAPFQSVFRYNSVCSFKHYN